MVQLGWMGLEPTVPESNLHLRSKMEHHQLSEAFHWSSGCAGVQSGEERGGEGKGEGGEEIPPGEF